MADSKWVGLRAAVAQTRLKGTITARDVAFVLAPRLNAAGRLGEADKGLELLMTASERRARELAVYLDARNSERRKVQDKMFDEALAKADPHAPALVLDDPGWHPGVMGIVASKLLERFYKPVFITAKGKGSVRSTPGISAVGGLRFAAEHLERYGGHSQAAGFAIRDANLTAFREAIFAYVEEHPTPERTVIADALIAADEIDDDLYKAIQKLEPYGEGHAAPSFALSDRLDLARAVGQAKTTLQLRVAGIKGVAWQKGGLAETLPSGETVNTVISLQENTWNDRRTLEFLAEEVRTAEPLSFEAPLAHTSPAHSVRGKPQDGTIKPVTALEGLEPHARTVWLQALPLASDPLCATYPLTTLLSEPRTVYFDLDTNALRQLEQTFLHYPTLQDVRRGFVRLQRGQPLPFDGTKAKLVRAVLHELELLDEHNRVLRGQKRDPYSSETLLTGLTERYKLQTCLNAYLHLDDASFAATVGILFSS